MVAEPSHVVAIRALLKGLQFQPKVSLQKATAEIIMLYPLDLF
jgi:hypothetical protein